jgi:tetratricopeptide (TPR) repeat protein
MKTTSFNSSRLLCLSLAFFAITAPASRSQNQTASDLGIVEGTVCDSQNHPLAAVAISLQGDDRAQPLAVRSDPHGHYRFAAVPPGRYTLRVSTPGSPDGKEGPFVVHPSEKKSITVRLPMEQASTPPKGTLPAVEFSDEPQFSVAGVTDPSNLGGHGSDTVLRTKESLAKETAALNHEGANPPSSALHGEENIADTHARRGDLAESEGRPLDALQEYQKAAELLPNETHLFAWGAELLLHRAFEPAIEVFTKGHRLYPDSVRMLLGLSVATYDQGATEQGEQLLVQACDLNLSDPTPYLFMGKLQQAEKIEPPGWTERLSRFVTLHPGNALAHYYYAVALAKQSPGIEDFATIESELKRAIALDPQLGDAYLQLGILYSAKKDDPAAISALQKAIQILPLPEEAHYRLAQLYRRTGDTENARQQMALYNQTSQQKTKLAEQQRHEIQQFVYTLKGQPAPSPNPPSKPQ